MGLMEKQKVGFLKCQVDVFGTAVVRDLCEVFWYLDPFHDTLRRRHCKRYLIISFFSPIWMQIRSMSLSTLPRRVNVTVDEMKAYYGLLILMDIMRYDRDEMYWSDNGNFWLVGSKFGDVMPRDRYVQIKRYLHFSDDTGNAGAGDKLHKGRFMLDQCRTSFQREYDRDEMYWSGT